MSKVHVNVKVHPRARQPHLVWDGTQLEIWVHEPPVDGAANQAVLQGIARWLDISRSAVQVVSGHSSKIKLVEVDGVEKLPPPDTLL